MHKRVSSQQQQQQLNINSRLIIVALMATTTTTAATAAVCIGSSEVGWQQQQEKKKPEQQAAVGDQPWLPPGFRFHPTDEELVSYYLAKKVYNSSSFSGHAIAEVDLNKCEPWDLPGTDTLHNTTLTLVFCCKQGGGYDQLL